MGLFCDTLFRRLESFSMTWKDFAIVVTDYFISKKNDAHHF